MVHRQRKRFGQHFLHDPGVIRNIIEAIDPSGDDTIIEIGPGLGAITQPLLQRVKLLTAVEIDRDAAAALTEQTAAAHRLNLIVADALKTDFCAILANLPGQPRKARVVGNLPYNISTPLMFHLLDQIACIEDMHFMLQKEVVRRMAAEPGSKQYGRLTIMLALRCRVETLFDIGPGAFNPPPRVASSFVRLLPDDSAWRQLQNFSLFETIVRAAFSGRRKTLRRSLSGHVQEEAFETAGIDAGLRPERLCVLDFVRLANACATGQQSAL